MTDEELRQRFPFVRWDEPVQVSIAPDMVLYAEHADDPVVDEQAEFTGWGCRYCIAHYGLNAQDVLQGLCGYAFAFLTEAELHLLGQHPPPG